MQLQMNDDRSFQSSKGHKSITKVVYMTCELCSKLNEKQTNKYVVNHWKTSWNAWFSVVIVT